MKKTRKLIVGSIKNTLPHGARRRFWRHDDAFGAAAVNHRGQGGGSEGPIRPQIRL